MKVFFSRKIIRALKSNKRIGNISKSSLIKKWSCHTDEVRLAGDASSLHRDMDVLGMRHLKLRRASCEVELELHIFTDRF